MRRGTLNAKCEMRNEKARQRSHTVTAINLAGGEVCKHACEFCRSRKTWRMKIKWLVLAMGALLMASSAHGDIETKNFNPAVKPQDDFYQYANGGWLAANPIP